MENGRSGYRPLTPPLNRRRPPRATAGHTGQRICHRHKIATGRAVRGGVSAASPGVYPTARRLRVPNAPCALATQPPAGERRARCNDDGILIPTMAQTLTALAALVVATTLAFTTLRSNVHVEQATVRSEVETAAGNVAADVLSHIAAQPFDAATAGGAAVSSPDQLTPTAQFAQGRTFAAAVGVDDFHRMAPLARPTAVGGVTATVTATVRYVTEQAVPPVPPQDRTYFKEITVTATARHLLAPVVLTQIVSCPWLRRSPRSRCTSFSTTSRPSSWAPSCC